MSDLLFLHNLDVFALHLRVVSSLLLLDLFLLLGLEELGGHRPQLVLIHDGLHDLLYLVTLHLLGDKL